MIGELFYDGSCYIFQKTKLGDVVFAEIRGFGANLPMDENAEKIVRLWNEDLKASAETAKFMAGLSGRS